MGKATGERGRKSISPDEKKILVGKVTALKLEGETTESVAVALGLAWGTVDKYYREILLSQGDIEPLELIKERRLQTERLLGKTLRNFYAGTVGMKDVAIAIQLADTFNGVSQYLDKLVVATQLPPLLEIIVQNVNLDLPPTNT
jgi:hypothetical protein